MYVQRPIVTILVLNELLLGSWIEMNIQVVILSVVLAAFIGLWSNDHSNVVHNVPAIPAAPHRNEYGPTGPLSAKPTPLYLTSGRQSQVALTLPKGIAEGRYVAVNQLGEVRSVTVTVSDLGQEVDPSRDTYKVNQGDNRWFFCPHR